MCALPSMMTLARPYEGPVTVIHSSHVVAPVAEAVERTITRARTHPVQIGQDPTDHRFIRYATVRRLAGSSRTEHDVQRLRVAVRR